MFSIVPNDIYSKLNKDYHQKVKKKQINELKKLKISINEQISEQKTAK